jgi:hypothetical protein
LITEFKNSAKIIMLKTTIITAASEKYADSLFALIGSLNCNWPNHPTIVVYDIGLGQESLSFLFHANIEVRKVPPFCEHWRKHYTWKIWCLNDIETENVIWIDSGICVLDDLNEIIDEINLRGYFLVPNYQFLDWEASEDTCKGCGVEYSFRIGKGTIAATMMGFKKKGEIKSLLQEAMDVAKVEKNIVATDVKHKHDQAIFSILIYKHLLTPILHDGFIYLGWQSPRMVESQKVWVHRRGMLRKDMLEYKKRIMKPGAMYQPKDPNKDTNILQKLKIQTLRRAKLIGKRILALNKPTEGIR